MTKRKRERKEAIIFVRATATQRKELSRLAKALEVSEAECVREGLRLLAAHTAHTAAMRDAAEAA